MLQVPPPSPGLLQRQPSVGNVLARTSSFGSASGMPPPSGNAGVTRQGSQTSLFEQFAVSAKELVRETTRQSSQDGLLAHMDKVSIRQPNTYISVACQSTPIVHYLALAAMYNNIHLFSIK